MQGHPDPARERLCRHIESVYQSAALAAGHEVTVVDTATLSFPLLRTREEWNAGRAGTPASLINAQQACERADHLVLIYPLWLGTMPARLKGFLEQVLRPGVALDDTGRLPKPLFQGKSARVVVTMGMPAGAYRWFYRAHSLRSLERNILRFCGVKPVRATLVGGVENLSTRRLQKLDRQISAFGAAAC